MTFQPAWKDGPAIGPLKQGKKIESPKSVEKIKDNLRNYIQEEKKQNKNKSYTS